MYPCLTPLQIEETSGQVAETLLEVRQIHNEVCAITEMADLVGMENRERASALLRQARTDADTAQELQQVRVTHSLTLSCPPHVGPYISMLFPSGALVGRSDISMHTNAGTLLSLSPIIYYSTHRMRWCPSVGLGGNTGKVHAKTGPNGHHPCLC